MTTEAAKLERDYLPLWEIASIVTSFLIAEWVVLAFVGSSKLILAVPVGLALALMVISHRERGETLSDIGFRLDNFAVAARSLALPTIGAVLLIVAVAWILNQSLISAPWRNRFLLLPLWALVQQYALNGFIHRRAQLVMGKGGTSVLVVALVFGLLHLPNPVLSLLTFVGGLVWALVYQRHPNLFALALSHSIISITLALAVSSKWLDSLRVGFKFFG
ncbi:MAG TPA: CPBP family intramembrane glutamic endopeptidase [Pyrinomonadaceae bacterium]|nr:CPBP family intramembrane glutamic endopeptidase [Pyrinomonadaceae bacterium]